MDQEVKLKALTPKKTSGTKILKLVLDGFKSFGKHTELILGDDFNVVIGPNGSGKSNIMDALCFVLGKSSSKQLRAEKSANLIYNGGKTKQPAKQAEVSIVFDNSQGTFPLPNSEIKISRIVRSTGSSKYKINNQTRTRTEVVELLSSSKIDPDGYNIILQGDIVRLVEMSGVERRQIIEDISGIGAYESRKSQALKELGKVEEKLNEAEIILKERESYLKDLKKDRDEAIKYKDLKDKVSQNKASYLSRKLNRKEKQKDALDKRRKELEEKVQKLIDSSKKLRAEITQRKDQIKAINKEIEQKGEVEQVALQKQVERIRVELATKKVNLSNGKTQIERIKQRREQLKKSKDELDSKFGDVSNKAKHMALQLSTIQKTVSELNSKIVAFRKKHNLANEAQIDAKFAKIDIDSEEKQKQVQKLRETQQELIREKDKVEYQIATIDEKIARVQELENDHKEEVTLLKNRKAEFKKLVVELNNLLNQDSKDANSLATLRKDLHESREYEQSLRLKQNAIKASLGGSIAVKKILENKKMFGSIYGTVAELGSSESKFSTALEVAAASRINSLIVDSDKTAASAIRYLKSEKLGSATFLPLNKIKDVEIKTSAKQLAKDRGAYGLAIDLIDFDLTYKRAFSQIFGSTVVVENIACARRLGIGRARMVTLDGDLCESSGAMTGGFRHKKAGRFGQKELAKKLERAQYKMAKLESDLSTLQSRRLSSEDKIVRLRELKASLEGEIIKQEKSLHLNTGDFDASISFKKELAVQLKDVNKRLGAIDDSVSSRTRELVNLKMERQDLRTKIAQLRNPRVLAELNAFEEKKKQLENECIRLEGEKRHSDLQLTDVLGRDKENIIKLLTELKSDESKLKESTSVEEKEIKVQERGLKQKEQEQKVFFSKFKNLFEKRNKFGDEINVRESKALGFEERSRREEMQLNAFSIEDARIKAELASMQAQFEKYAGVELNLKKPEEQLKKEIADFERMMVRIGNVNMRALEIYDTVEKEYEILTNKKTVLLTEKNDVLNLMEEIESSKKELFMKSLNIINDEFKRIFSELMSKGQAYLELEEPNNPFDGGLKIKVRLTGNKYLDIRSLSGGEKTMTALAFLFAIQEHEPASFYVLDEVDAALDKHNSERLASLIRNYCTKAQYLVISHNDALIAEGDILYGVSMSPGAGLSKVVSLKL